MDTVKLIIKGRLADHIEGSAEITNPTEPDELWFRDLWLSAERRNFGRGYRLTLDAPKWAWLWIREQADAVLWSSESSKAERAAAKEMVLAIDGAGITDADCGPTRDELVAAGYVEAEQEGEDAVTIMVKISGQEVAVNFETLDERLAEAPTVRVPGQPKGVDLRTVEMPKFPGIYYLVYRADKYLGYVLDEGDRLVAKHHRNSYGFPVADIGNGVRTLARNSTE